MKKSPQYLKSPWPWLVGCLILLGASRWKSSNPETAIKRALKGTPWRNMAPFVIAQAKHETGNFTSNIFRENNNLFGMKKPFVRKTLAIGENRGHAVFRSIQDSAKDLLLWFEYTRFPQVQTVEQYVQNLKQRGYFEDSQKNYWEGLKRWL